MGFRPVVVRLVEFPSESRDQEVSRERGSRVSFRTSDSKVTVLRGVDVKGGNETCNTSDTKPPGNGVGRPRGYENGSKTFKSPRIQEVR